VALGLCSAKQGRRELQRALGKHFRGTRLGRKFLECCFLKWCILVQFIFFSDGGPPNVAGPGGNFPFTLPPIDGPGISAFLTEQFYVFSACSYSLRGVYLFCNYTNHTHRSLVCFYRIFDPCISCASFSSLAFSTLAFLAALVPKFQSRKFQSRIFSVPVLTGGVWRQKFVAVGWRAFEAAEHHNDQ